MFASCDVNRFFDLVSSFARPPKNRSTIFQYKCKFENKGKDRPTRTLRVAFLVASHCRLQIIFLLSQASLQGIFPLCRRLSKVLKELFSARADHISDSNVLSIFVKNF